MTYDWRTYGETARARTGWIEEIEVRSFVRNQLRREVSRLQTLVSTGRYYGPGDPPIPQRELDDFAHDLALWRDPKAVLTLLRSGYPVLGPKSTVEAIAAIEKLITDE